jgi:hypothetical protein
MRTLMSSAQMKTRRSLWALGATKPGEDVPGSADLLPRIPSSEENILLDESLEMQLNGVVTVLNFVMSHLWLVTFNCAPRDGKAEGLCALILGCISP